MQKHTFSVKTKNKNEHFKHFLLKRTGECQFSSLTNVKLVALFQKGSCQKLNVKIIGHLQEKTESSEITNMEFVSSI